MEDRIAALEQRIARLEVALFGDSNKEQPPLADRLAHIERNSVGAARSQGVTLQMLNIIHDHVETLVRNSGK